eukprot:m.20030 g.20030  ORF g.20030 m.20030 type:complete len:304 (+) comp3493_c0_seq1:406-1317(+)
MCPARPGTGRGSRGKGRHKMGRWPAHPRRTGFNGARSPQRRGRGARSSSARRKSARGRSSLADSGAVCLLRIAFGLELRSAHTPCQLARGVRGKRETRAILPVCTDPLLVALLVYGHLFFLGQLFPREKCRIHVGLCGHCCGRSLTRRAFGERREVRQAAHGLVDVRPARALHRLPAGLPLGPRLDECAVLDIRLAAFAADPAGVRTAHAARLVARVRPRRAVLGREVLARAARRCAAQHARDVRVLRARAAAGTARDVHGRTRWHVLKVRAVLAVPVPAQAHRLGADKFAVHSRRSDPPADV